MGYSLNLKIIRELCIIAILVFLFKIAYEQPQEIPYILVMITVIYMGIVTTVVISQRLFVTTKIRILLSTYYIYTIAMMAVTPTLFSTAFALHIIGLIALATTIHNPRNYIYIISVFIIDVGYNFYVDSSNIFIILSIIFVLTAYLTSSFHELLNHLHTKIDTLSRTDDFTGLLNQKGFLEQLENEFYRSKRYDKTFILIMLDSDGLKRVNDTYGHMYGSKVIKMISSVIHDHTRRTDFAGRYGGDEFMICLVESSKEDGIAFAERLRKTVEMKSLFTDKGKELDFTVSIGVSAYPKSGKELYDVIEKADKALYQAKAEGKNNVQFA